MIKFDFKDAKVALKLFNLLMFITSIFIALIRNIMSKVFKNSY